MKSKVEQGSNEQRYQQELIHRNCTNFKLFTQGGSLITSLILMFGIVRGQQSLFTPQYIFFFLYMAALYGIACFCNYRQTKYIIWVYYLGIFPIYIAAILMGTFFDNDQPAITIFVLLCGLTLFIIDKPWRLLGYITGIGILFAIASYMTKESAIFKVDMVNLVIFGMISIAVNYTSLRQRIENAENYLLLQEGYKRRLSALLEMDSDNLIAKGQHNLTQDKVLFYASKNESAAKVINEGTYHEAVEALAAVVFPDKKEEIRKITSRENLLAEFAKGETDGSLRFQRRKEDGEIIWTKLRYSLYQEPVTKNIIAFMYSYDITEAYEKEQEQLSRIEEALKTAEIASKAKTEFFSRMSHDMRTPMNGILGLANLSRDEDDVTVLKENISKIEESGQYLLGLINDTLDFQRIESGKLVLEPQGVRTSEIVNNIVDMVKQTAKEKGVTLNTKYEGVNFEEYINVDPLRIKQIFVNLLSNAVKFTPAGGTVELIIRRESQQGSITHNIISVEDTGIGMSEDFLQNKIFKPFSQESNQVTTQYAGSGLGLSIAKNLVEMMNGRIEVESEIGVGTKFNIFMDFEHIDASEIESDTSHKVAYTQNINEKLIGTNILLVEDHPLNAEIAIKLMKKVGCEVEWLQNGQQAVDYFKHHQNKQYDMVLMDIRMPVMDGLEAARQIRALDDGYAKEVPIIAMTANAYDEDVHQSKLAGMNAHLSKPIEPDKLYNTLITYKG